MNTIFTAVLPGQSGLPNQFKVATERNDAGKIIGVDVQVVEYGDSTDLSRANLVRLLTIQKQLVKTKDAQFTIKKYIALVELGADVTFTISNPLHLKDMTKQVV